MAEPKRKKKSKKRKKIERLLISLSVLMVAVFGALYVVGRTVGNVALSNVADVFLSFTVRENSAFPYKADASTVLQISPINSNYVCVVYTDRLEVISRKGSLMQKVPHTYTKPAISIRNGRILLYERGGTRYQLLSKTGILLDNVQTSDPILSAALSPKGMYAIATTSSGFKSLLTVYSGHGEETFKFKCVSEYITDVDFPGKTVTVTAAGVKAAEAYSRVMELNLKKTEPTVNVTYEDTSFFHTHNAGRVNVALGRTAICIVKNGSQEPDEIFGSDTLQSYCTEENGKLALALRIYGNEHAVKIRGVQRNGGTMFENTIEQAVHDIARSEGYITVLTDTGLLTFNNSGTQVGSTQFVESAQKICLAGRNVFVLFSDRIEVFSAVGDHTVKAQNG